MKELEQFYAESGPERIGFILEDGTIVETENVCPEPEKGFKYRPEDLIKYGDRAIASWHTHPGQHANLSLADHEGFQNYPKWKHYIVGKDGVRCYVVKQWVVAEDG